MPKKVKWNTTVNIEDGPTLTTSGELNSASSNLVNAVDVFNVVVASSPTATTVVAVQPGQLSKVEFIYIASDQYGDGDATKKISYQFSEGSNPADKSDSVDLEKAHLLTSRSLVGLFKKAPREIIITNTTGRTANIDIVVARNANNP